MPQNKLSIEEILKQEQAKKSDIDAKKAARLVGDFFRAEGLRDNAYKNKEASERMWQDPQHKVKRQQTLMATNALPEVKARRSKAAVDMYNRPEVKAAHEKGMAELRADPVRWARYQVNQEKGNKSKYDNPEYWVNYYAGIARRESDKTYHTKRLAKSKEVICRKVQTPLGIFDSITDAARAHGMGNTETMRNRLKSPNFPEYQHLDDNVRPKNKK